MKTFTGHRRRASRVLNRPAMRPLPAAVFAAIGMLAGGPIGAAGPAPAPGVRIPTTAVPVGPTTVSGSFNPYTVSPVTGGKVTATITQNSNSGILKWSSFDIGQNATVKINQPSSSAVLLNQVTGGAYQNMTVIEGMLNANGQVYIYNANGIVFGKTSQVNVNSLVATTLAIDQSRFLSGILTPSINPLFAADSSALLNPGATTPGSIIIEGDSANQASIVTANGGRIMMVAPQVSNNGVLKAVDGQVVLAAGESVYLSSPTDNSMRGLVVQVGANASTDLALNDVLGNIAVGHGNATLVGLAVNQMGTIKANTSVNLNGSIFLKAVAGATVGSSGAAPQDGAWGTLTVGDGTNASVTRIDPDLADPSGVALPPVAPQFIPSQVVMAGQHIVMQNNSSVVANGGQVAVTATSNPSAPNTGRVDFEAGSLIDVSGSTGTVLAMESNVIPVQLRGNELADYPILQNSPIRGATLYIDIRKGTKIADVSGYLSQVTYNVGQMTAAGGTVSVVSDGDIIQRAGSTINVSGGSVNFASGYIDTTKLTYNGTLTDIGSGLTTIAYDGYINPGNSAATYQAGYVQGYSAGGVTFNAPAVALQGSLAGSVTIGPLQRDIAAGNRPLGGSLTLGSWSGSGRPDVTNPINIGFTDNVVIGGQDSGATLPQPGAAFAAGALPTTVNLDLNALAANGFTRVAAVTAGDVSVVAPVNLAAGGSLILGAAGNVNLDANITAPGGKVIAVAAGALDVAAGGNFDLSGRWTNDSGQSNPALDSSGRPVSDIVLAGGSVDLSGSQVTIGNNVSIDVSGGAWLGAKNALTAGKAGSIALAARGDINPGATLQLGSGLTLEGYGLAAGGSLTLTGRNVMIGAPAASANDIGLDPAFFTQGGFTKYQINANADLTVAPGATVQPSAQSWQLNKRTDGSAPSGSMESVATVAALDLVGPNGGRPPTSINLTAGDQAIFSTGASLTVDPRASVNFIGANFVAIDGTISAPAGSVGIGLSYGIPGPTSTDYSAQRAIWFGPDASILADGTASLIYTNTVGVSSGSVLGGGSIKVGLLNADGSVSAATGYVVAQAGSSFDVSGITSAPLSFKSGRSSSTATPIGSDGGSIEIRAREGLLFAGALKGAGGTGAQGGSLTVALDRENEAALSPYPQQDRVLTLSATAPAGGIIPAGLSAGQPIVGREGQGWLTLGSFAAGGFDRLDFKSQNVIAFAPGTGSLTVSAPSSLTFDAPVLSTSDSGTVNLSSSFVQLGSADWRYQTPPAASGGAGTLTVNATTGSPAAGVIDMVGNSVTQGFGQVNLNAGADIRLIGTVLYKTTATGGQGAIIDPTTSPDPSQATDVLYNPYALGMFSAGGNLNLTSAQTYVTTLSNFTLNAPGTVTFSSNGSAPVAPLSAAGSLTVNANKIVQNGTLAAPFGSIALNATTEIDYGAGSLTSVAGSGVVPFGYVQNGSDWIYDFGNGWAVNFATTSSGTNNLLQATLPVKSITSSAPVVNLAAATGTAAGATLDLNGGGSLYAYQFTPGPGGSKDILANATSGGNTFAIIPGFASGIAPYDPLFNQDNSLNAGDSVYLSGMPGLAAGVYTLLPAHYALLSPNAYTVTLTSGTQNMSATANRVNNDGSNLVAGYFLTNTTGAASGSWNGFTVLNSAQVRARAEYADFSATPFFTAQAASSGVAMPALPGDGGHVIFNVGDTLTMNGTVNLAAADGGARGIADISSSGSITVVPDGATAASGVTMTAGQLSAMNPDSLLLGGIRYDAADGTQHLVVNASNVTVGTATNSPVALSGNDIILAATDTVAVLGGASVTGTGTPDRAPEGLTLVTAANTATMASGAAAEGALLRVTGSGAPIDYRGTLLATPSKGTLAISAGANVSASGGVVLDATKSFNIANVLALGNGGALSVGASSISLGDAIPSTVGGLSFGSGSLAYLNTLSSLSLSSYSAPIGFYGSAANPFNLGNSGMALTLQAQGIQAYGAGNAQVTASSLTLVGGNGYTPADAAVPATPPGNLSLSAGNVSFGNGNFQATGYSNLTVTATRQAIGTGNGGSFSANSNLTIAAGRITAASGSNTTIASSGALNLTTVANPQAPAGASPAGGRLQFSGNTVTSSADVEAHSGRIDMTATNGLSITGQSLDVSGATTQFGDTVAYAPGGSIYLNGGAGNVTVAAGATLNVSATGADAGLLSITATNGSNGQAVLNGVLLGGAATVAGGSAPAQGSFIMDVDQIPNLGPLSTQLDAAGFTQSRNLRVRHGDVSLAAGQSMTALQTVMTADNGNITIGGTINASGAGGGSIALYAGEAGAGSNSGNVIIQSTAVLNAAATAAASSAAGSVGDGGSIVINTSTADGSQPTGIAGSAGISIASGAQLNVAAGSNGQGGSVLLQAPRVSANNNVAVTVTNASTLANAVQGAANFAVEGNKVYYATIINTASVETLTTSGSTVTAVTPSGTYYTDANNFLSTANRTSMQTRLGTAASLQPGIEIRSTGDLTVSVNETNATSSSTTAANPQDRGWNLNAWRFGSQPGVLTLRAAGNLIINGSISDGFTKPASGTTAANKLGMPDWTLASGPSWSYRLVGGADLASANPLTVTPNTSGGSFQLNFARTSSAALTNNKPTASDQPVALVRTGTGFIDIAAGGDIVLGSTQSTTGTLLGAEIYTGGAPVATPGFTAPTNALNTQYAATSSSTAAMFASGGGDISLYANGNITGDPTLQMVDNWLFRQGRLNTNGVGYVANPAWWSRYDYFNQGVATFGGGDISVIAKNGNISNLSVSAATDAWSTITAAGSVSLVQQGGGNVNVRAGGNIQGGVYYVQTGAGVLHADGSLTQGNVGSTNVAWSGTQYMYPVLAMGDSTFAVTAGGSLGIEGVFNPTLADQSKANLGVTSTWTDSNIPKQYSAYSTYGANSGVTLTAVSGDLTLAENQILMTYASNAGSAASNQMIATGSTGYLRNNFMLIMPGSLQASALNGNVSLGNGFSLWPQANGNLSLLASGSIAAQQTLNAGWSQPLVMLDIDPSTLPTPLNPRKLATSGSVSAIYDFNLWSGNSVNVLNAHTGSGLHVADSQPVRLIATGGNIDFSLANAVSTPLILPKAAEISAGNDIVNTGFQIQNMNATDVTTITAGRDFIDTTVATGQSNVSHILDGPGRLDITAGRNIDLGNGQGIVTRGNLDNPYLPDGGASINLQAGATADYAGFFLSYVQAADLPTTAQTALISYVQQINPSLPANLDPVTALTYFQGLSAAQRNTFLTSFVKANKPLLNDIYFNKIAIATGAKTDPATGTTDALNLPAFDALVNSLFPKPGISGGNINVFGSEVETQRGGSIDLFTPGGSVYAGLINVPAYLQDKSASQLGIFTVGGGEIRSLVNQDFLVNQGRVFTLGGGDITLVSQYGNIDAGRGAKTAASAPPPLLTVDPQGNVTLDIAGSISGSGIATLSTNPLVPASNVYPIAPRGIFDAGDAGVRSTGAVSIVANQVLNAGNITAAGSVSGSHVAVSTSTTPAAAPANTQPTKTDSFANPGAGAPNGNLSLTVELVGLAGDALSGGGQQTVTQDGQNDSPGDGQ